MDQGSWFHPVLNKGISRSLFCPVGQVDEAATGKKKKNENVDEVVCGLKQHCGLAAEL